MLTGPETAAATPVAPLADQDLLARVSAGDLSAFELLMRRHNQRLYRTIRAVLRDGADVEDVMQETYVAAFAHLPQFEGRAQFSTWLLRIGVNQALASRRGRPRLVPLDQLSREEGQQMQHPQSVRTPEDGAAHHEMVALVEAAIDGLPLDFRQVLVLRGVEGLDTADTAAVLGLTADVVKQRLHRARAMLNEKVEAQVGTAVVSAFGFLGDGCDRVVANVMRRLSP